MEKITEKMLEDYKWVYQKNFMWKIEARNNNFISPRPHQPFVVWNHSGFKDFLKRVERLTGLMNND